LSFQFTGNLEPTQEVIKIMKLSRLVKSVAMLLISAMLSNSLAFAAKRLPDAAVMKAKLEHRGVGRGVRVVLADKTEAKGLIGSLGEQSFTVKVKNADQPQEIQYAQVTSVHNDKLSTGQKIGIGVEVLGVAVLITAIVFVHEWDKPWKIGI
jgi:hypothetical protein